LLRSKLKITKIEHYYNPSLNTATKLFNEPDRNGHSALLIDKKISAFSVVSVSDDHVVYNRP